MNEPGEHLDIVERCQSELHRQWMRNGEDAIWHLSRAQLSRFLEVDHARLELPDSWRKLIALANLSESMREDLGLSSGLTEQEFEELYRWSLLLGPALSITESLKEKGPESPPFPGGESTPGSEKKSDVSLKSTSRHIRLGPAFAASISFLVVGLSAGWLVEYARTIGIANQNDVLKRTASALRVENNQGSTALKQSKVALESTRLESKRKGLTVETLQKELQGKSQLLLQMQKAGTSASIPHVQPDFRQRTESAGVQDETVGPVFSCVGSPQPIFSWSADIKEQFEILVFEPKGRIVQARSPSPLDPGAKLGGIDRPLQRGHYYEWVLAAKDPSKDIGPLSHVRNPFRVLSFPEAQAAANTFRQLCLYYDMLSLGGVFEKEAREKIEELEKKSR